MRLRPLSTVFLSIAILSFAAPTVLRPASGSPRGQTPDLPSLSDLDLKSVTIRLQRTGCFGNCAAYAVTIHGDGRVEYMGTKDVKAAESRRGEIQLGAVRALVAEFARAKFLAIADDYSGTTCSCRQCTDMASAITELTLGSVSHRINHYLGCACAPKALFELESAIDKAVNVEQWTGDVSKQGPFATTCFGP